MKRPAGTRHLAAIVAAAMAVILAGCVLKGKPPAAAAVPPAPKPVAAPAPAPAAPPPPLSIPQTRAELPAPQPVSTEALATTEPPGEPPAPPPAPPKKGQRSSSPRPKPAEAAAPANPPAVATPPAEPERAPIQEIIPAEDLNRLRASANARKEEIRQRLERLPRRGLTKEQRDVVDTIRSFVRLSDEAERSGDMRKANELAERGAVLAQGLPGGR